MRTDTTHLPEETSDGSSVRTLVGPKYKLPRDLIKDFRHEESKPIFLHSANSDNLLLLMVALFAGFFGFGAFFDFPIDVPGIVFWLGVGIIVVISVFEQWRKGVRHVLFYDDHMEVVTRVRLYQVAYPEVVGIRSFWGRLILTTRVPGIPTISIHNARIEGLGVNRKSWLSRRVPEEAFLPPEPIAIGMIGSFSDNLGTVFGKGAKWVVLVFVAQSIALVVIPSIPFLPGEQQFYALMRQQEPTIASMTPFGGFEAIFLNNVRAGLFDLLPGLGIGSLMSATYNTARVVQIDALGRLLPSSAYASYLFLFPHSWLELSGYAVAIYEAMHISNLWQKMTGRPGLRKFIAAQILAALGLVLVMIAVAAAFEEAEILVGIPLAVVTWIPVGLAIPVVLVALRRRRTVAVQNAGLIQTVPVVGKSYRLHKGSLRLRRGISFTR